MLPADQRLHADNPAGHEVDDRLIVKDELGGDVRATEVRDKLEPAHEVLVHSRRVDEVLRLPAGLRAVHGDIGAPQQLLRVAPHCDADARRDEHLASVDVERRLQRGGDPFGCVECGRDGVCPLYEDRELVTTHPRDRVRRGHGSAQTHAYLPEQGVRGDVAEAVVDRLEVVEVEEENSGVARTYDERVLDAIREERPVREPGQRVVEGLVAKLLLGLLTRRDVEEVPLKHGLTALRVVDDARLVVHPHDASVPRVQTVFDAERLARRLRSVVRGKHSLSVVPMQELDEERRVRHPLLDRIAEHVLDLRARVDVRARGVHTVDVDGQWKLLDECSVAGLGQPNSVVGSLSLGDVDREPLSERGPALGRLHVNGHVFDPDEPAVPGVHPILVAQRRAARIGVDFLGEDTAAIVLVNRELEQIGHRDPLLCGVAEHRLDLRADIQGLRTRIGFVVDVRDERQLLDERAVAELGGPEPLFRVRSLADVANAGREHGGAGNLDTADRELGRKLGSVRAHRQDLDPAAEESTRTRRRPMLGPALERPAMRLAERRGNDECRKLAAENVLLRVSECALSRAVELQDTAMMVDRDHGVERRIEDRARVRRISAQRCLYGRRPVVAILDHRLTRIVASPRPATPRSGYGLVSRRRRAGPGRG